MHLIFKALLALALLAPTLATAQPAPEADFIRIQRNESRDPIALQTAIVKYAGENGVEVDLIGAVHVGEAGYYERLNEAFKKYDVVLYELVAPEGTRPPRGVERQGDNPLAIIQQLMKLVLKLEHQVGAIDYHKPNLVHADLSLEGMRKAIKDRGEDEMTVLLNVLKEVMEKMAKDAGKTGPAPQEIDSFERLFMLAIEYVMNPNKLKREFAEQLVKAGGDTGFGKTFHQLIVVDRNLACLEVMKKQIAAGKKKIGIFYGAAHNPDFDMRLRRDFSMKRTSSEWVTAWNLR